MKKAWILPYFKTISYADISFPSEFNFLTEKSSLTQAGFVYCSNKTGLQNEY